MLHAPTELLFNSPGELRSAPYRNAAFQANRQACLAIWRRHQGLSRLMGWGALASLVLALHGVAWLLVTGLLGLGWARAARATQRAATEAGRWRSCEVATGVAGRLTDLIALVLGPEFELRIATVSLRDEASLVSRVKSGDDTDSHYQLHWLRLQGKLPSGLLLQTSLCDDLKVHEHQGDPEYSGSWSEEQHRHEVHLNLFSSQPLDHRFGELRRRWRELPPPLARGEVRAVRYNLPQGTRSGVRLVLSQEGQAELEALVAGLEWLGRFVDVLDAEPRPPLCPGCGRGLEGTSCSACRATWVDRQSLSWSTHLPPAEGPSFGQRDCPGCQARLRPTRVRGHLIEACQECGGFWVGQGQSLTVGSPA